jgi:hypothetical protein
MSGGETLAQSQSVLNFPLCANSLLPHSAWPARCSLRIRAFWIGIFEKPYCLFPRTTRRKVRLASRSIVPRGARWRNCSRGGNSGFWEASRYFSEALYPATKGQLEGELAQRAWLKKKAVREVLELERCPTLWRDITSTFGPWFQLVAESPDDLSLS